ncbi:MAG: flagellar basal-body MS-ring/collar protein FliF [Sandaracinaceae bacterium]
MTAGVQARLAQLEARWKALTLRMKAAILVGVAVVVAVGLVLAARGAEPSRAILFSDLSPEDAARIVDRLRALDVDYALDDGGTTIRVPDAQVHETRLTLAAEGLPSGGGVGFEIFDRQRFGESDFSEQVQFRRALEGELARTIAHLAGVESARVHLVLPERTLFTTEEAGARASVAIHLRPGWRLRDEQVRGVSHLVASSVAGLRVEDVTVVDGDGRALTAHRDGEAAALDEARDLRTSLEQSRERAVQQMLDASLGPGVAVVRVSADLSLSEEEQLEETYDPERIATRSFEVQEEANATAEVTAEGVPGAASNLPGGPAPEGGAEGRRLARRHERRNYEVTKTVHRAVHPVGRLARMTVAVVVDGVWTGDGDAREFSPRPQEELDRIEALVSSAAGIDASRGDVVTVECVPFHGSAHPAAHHGPTLIDHVERWTPYVLGALAVLALLVGAGVLWRRHSGALAAASGKPHRLLELASGDDGQAAALDLEPAHSLADYEQLRALALEVARRDPALAAHVVRGWLLEDVAASREEAA